MSPMDRRFEIIVIGGGHAGAEAAWAAARLGIPTAMITMQREAIGRMSCNPAIGGIGKGQMVREIDALGGLMGLATDRAGIQFRMLNRRKGPAVWAPRAQCDRDLYAAAVQELLALTPNLDIIEGTIEAIETTDTSPSPEANGGVASKSVKAVRLTDGRVLACRCVIVTTGTFLRALMHTGKAKAEGGRIGEGSAVGLSACLREMELELGRLKTGTPPRIARDSVDYTVLEEQPGDNPPEPFSFLTDRIDQRQVSCWITYTGAPAHELIRANLHRAPMYTGQIESRGPRYCPSIEDKVVRFADKDRHQIFLEPEGYESDRIYCNGISTSLPVDVQECVVRSIVGLERARILQWGYAVEYDFVPPHQIDATLQAKNVAGLYLAGQINGTSGYEEAAGQGLLAGINAARRVLGREPVVLQRDQAYIGVMIDDLVTRGVIEPYRMFTSRAEYRLLLRSDNADARLTALGREIGLVDDARWARFTAKRDAITAIRSWSERTVIDGVPLSRWLARTDGESVERVPWRAWRFDGSGRDSSGGGLGTLPALPDDLAGVCGRLLDEAFESAAIEAKYGGYVRRQLREVERFRKMESRRIPDGLDYHTIRQLRFEARERLSSINPRSIGQAQRISGINPADIAVLLLHLESARRTGNP
ncbi:tRNA uridine 5-carboxymethylaminomethyl modification enzyme MnmG [Phycisphaerae bacterium RAS2]|nr:tRNA uridine 5-carboxymethylaminomethyl modification enzyme MnmG [Phycisphaerae bacterium RAS2]